MFRPSSRRQQLFHEALSRESNKTKKTIDRGEGFRSKFPHGVVCLWIVFVGVVGYVLFFSTFLSLTNVEVIASGKVSTEEIQARIRPILDARHLFIFPGKNFFLVPKEKITTSLLAEYPVLESVSIERSFPHTLRILPREREKILLWCSGGPCAGVTADHRPKLHEKNFESRYDAIRLIVIDTSALPFQTDAPLPVGEYLEYFARLDERFPRELGQNLLKEASTPSRFSRELRVTTDTGWSLLVNVDIPLEEIFLSLKAFFDERNKAIETRPPLVLVDIRVPGRIFFTEVVTPEEQKKEEEEEKTEKKKKER